MPIVTSILDFGATATDEASVIVAGQAAIIAGSKVEAFFMRESTAENTVDDHEEAAVYCPLICGEIVPGAGYTIRAFPIFALASGTFNVQSVWS